MKTLLIALFSIISLSVVSCTTDNIVTYQEGGDAEYTVEYALIDPSAWVPVSLEDPYSWKLTHEIKSPVSNNIGEDGAILCFFRKSNSNWEMMPSTAVYWTEEGTTYSEEYWYSHDDDYIDFFYRYTEPNVSSKPVDRIEVKMVMLEGEFLQAYNSNVITIDTHDDFLSHVNSYEAPEYIIED